MSRRLLLVNLALAVVAVLCVASLVRSAASPLRGGAVARPRAPSHAPASSPEATGRSAPGTYSVVASRNLFSPTRNEAPTTAAIVGPVAVAPPNLPRPNLHGVVVQDSTTIAYLEDPTTKRVAGYRLGDTIAGGTVQAINDDRVVLARPDGTVDIRLRDPSRPRPPAPPAAGAPAPGQPAPPGTQPPPGGSFPPGGVPPGPALSQPPPGGAFPPGYQPPTLDQPGGPRRPMPPNLLRRMPQTQVAPGQGDGPSR